MSVLVCGLYSTVLWVYWIGEFGFNIDREGDGQRDAG